MIIKIPFAGFYDSLFDDTESIIENESAYFCEHQSEDTPVELHLTRDQVSEFLYTCLDFRKYENVVAREYVPTFVDYLRDTDEIDIDLEFSDMSSPKEYNFETDRIFAKISDEDVSHLWSTVDREKLAQVIRDRFTSRSGFISFYSNDLEQWSQNPLEYDPNELETLLLACMSDTKDMDLAIYYRLDEVFYRAFEEAIDWKAFETKCEDARDEMRAELGDTPITPIRDTHTIDMFDRRDNAQN